MDNTLTFRVVLCFILALLVLVLAARVGVSIYQLAHPDKIDVWCDWNEEHEGYDRSYKGPAGTVLNACDVRP